MGSVSLSGGQLPERAKMIYTDSRAFRMLGTAPFLGRVPSLADEAPDAPPVVCCGHNLWTQQFASDRDVTGKPVENRWPNLFRDRCHAPGIPVSRALLVGRRSLAAPQCL
jgi:hypothetical protein